MNRVVIYASVHHKNTEKIAFSIASEIKARAFNFYEARKEDVENADLIGFGSGVYLTRFHKGLIQFVDKLTDGNNKKAFIFSTSGIGKNFLLNRSHMQFRNLLEKKGFKVIDEFYCLGFDTYGPLKYIGGINRGRPNRNDIENAKSFARSLIEVKK